MIEGKAKLLSWTRGFVYHKGQALVTLRDKVKVKSQTKQPFKPFTSRQLARSRRAPPSPDQAYQKRFLYNFSRC